MNKTHANWRLPIKIMMSPIVLTLFILGFIIALTKVQFQKGEEAYNIFCTPTDKK